VAMVWLRPLPVDAYAAAGRQVRFCRYELIFLLVKSRSYWFDLDPIRVPHATTRRDRRNVAPQRSVDARRPPGRPGGRRRPGDSRPPKYGSYTPEVVGAQQ
jgi:hypothetical protein